MKIWTILQSIILGIAKLAGALVLLGFSLGVTTGRKSRADSSASQEDAVLTTQGAAEDMTKAIENAAKQVIKDLEERTMAAVKLLDEAEAKIARLKGMLDVYEDYVLDDGILEETTQEERGSEGQLSAYDETEQEPANEQVNKTMTAGENASQRKRDLVFRLANEGLSLQEIAKKTGIGCGEAELILNLRGNDD